MTLLKHFACLEYVMLDTLKTNTNKAFIVQTLWEKFSFMVSTEFGLSRAFVA
jgi:hypothetical protein